MINPNVIKRFEVDRLFGLHDYTLNFGTPHGARHESLIYGDNGTGKTTILKLMYHLLSPKPHEGSRTFLSQTIFDRLYMELVSGETIELVKGKEITLAFGSKNEETIIALIPDAEDQSIKPDRNPELAHYEKFLSDLKIEQLYLSDNRVILSSYRRFQRRRRMVIRHGYDNIEEARVQTGLENIDLNELAVRVRDIIRERLIDSSAYGQANVNSIYLDLAKRFATSEPAQKSGHPDVQEIERRVKNIQIEYAKASLLDLFPQVDFDAFVSVARQSVGPSTTALAVIESFLDTIEAQVKAVTPTADLLNDLVKEINSYFVNKRISFSNRSGLRVLSNQGRLRLEDLSSGERQLLFLLLVSFITRDEKSIVYIDEPELSLNIKWQRQLISSILKIIGGTETQLIAATHSFEILAGHREAILDLQEERSR